MDLIFTCYTSLVGEALFSLVRSWWSFRPKNMFYILLQFRYQSTHADVMRLIFIYYTTSLSEAPHSLFRSWRPFGLAAIY